MPESGEQFVARLVAEVPESAELVTEHVDYFGELLLHLLLPDLLAFTVDCFHDGRREVAARCLQAVDDGLRDGDEDVVNAVSVSFVEHVGAGEGETEGFIASWPQGLHDQQVRMDRALRRQLRFRYLRTRRTR